MQSCNLKWKIYRYFYINQEKSIFSSLSHLNYESTEDYLTFIKEKNLSVRSYDTLFIERRLSTEEKMYRIFSEKGGKPQIKQPYYFTLGKCHEWFYGKKKCFGSIEFSLDELDLTSVSFTYGDSMPTFMKEFSDGKEYRNNVYTYEEILQLIEKNGMPNIWNTHEKYGPENYIEVQVWTNEYFSQYSSNAKKFNAISSSDISEFTTRIVFANSRISQEAINQKTLVHYMDKCKNHPNWNWFSKLISKTNSIQFKKDIVHGIQHAQKCALMAFALATDLELKLIDFKTIVYAALFHDIGRNYDYKGKSHCLISSQKIGEYLHVQDYVHLELLKEAIANHDDQNINSDNFFLILLRDIDSLDYVRLGIGLYNTSYLKTKVAKSMIRFAIELNIYMYFDENFIEKMIRGVI